MQTNFTRQQLQDQRTAEAERILRRCVHCGLCAERCPVGAITMERVAVNTIWRIEHSAAPPAQGVLR